MSTKKKVVTLGIDLGTTMSCMAGMVHGQLSVIDNKDGERVTPSVVCFNKDSSQAIVGSNAILAAQTSPENLVYEVKRMFGKGYNHPDIQRSMKYWPFRLQEIKQDDSDLAKEKVEDNIGIIININGQEKIYEPIQISASVLNYLAESAKSRLGEFPTFIVITVPAYFHDGAKQRTLGAAKIAFSNKVDANNNPLKVETILLAEPTAAAMAYGSAMLKTGEVKANSDETVLVFDLGGGTYDVSILEFFYDPSNPVGEVKATDGDNHLGGVNFDNIIIDMAKDEYRKNFPGDEPTNSVENRKNEIRLRQEAIKVKSQLSTTTNATFNLSCYRESNGICFEISRNKFERAAKKLFDRLLEKIKGVLLSFSKITPVYDDDGYLDLEATRRTNNCTKNFNEIIQEAKSKIDRVIMVGGSSRIPKVQSILENFFGDSPNSPNKKVLTNMNPDESIAVGAGYYANACCPDAEDSGPKLLLVDNVPLNLNIETYGGVATPIITARTAIPAKQSQIFTTAADNQTQVSIVITQGNRPQSSENYLVGSFNLTGIAPARKGEPQIEVTIEVDHNNLLTVNAVDKKSGKSELFVQNMTDKLTDEDIERMKQVAAEHAKADELFSKRTEAKNQFENLLYEFQDKIDAAQISDEVKAQLRAKCDEEEAYLKSEAINADPSAIKKRMEQFSTTAAQMMGAAASGPAPGQTKAPEGDADVEEVL